MARDTDPDDDSPAGADREEQRGFDTQLLSDLSVNVVPIGIIVAFTLLVVVAPAGEAGDSVLLFHAALIGGVVLVSVVAGWAITRQGSPLEGSAARSYDEESNRD